MKRILAVLLLAFAHCGMLNAQAYPVKAIPQELMKDANVVIRYEETKVVQTDVNNGTTKYTIVLTVLNEDGKEHANIVIPQDKFNELKNFSGAVLNSETGKVIKKIGRSDLFTMAYSQDFESDSKYSIYRFKPSTYPFTVKYEYEIRHKNGILGYPAFMPITSFGMAVEKAEYTITIPQEQKLRYRSSNVSQVEPLVATNGKTVSYTWAIENSKPIRYEPFAPKLSTVMPVVRAAPEEFCMEGKCGNMASWESLGGWSYNLIQGKDNIPTELQAKLRSMVESGKTDKEKVQRLYEYMQSTTRYVNISMGIGGYEPVEAANVAKSGFGDCKALSNYLKAMLSAIGIPSVYVAISTEYRNLYPDFPSFTQMNHVILMVPLAIDTLWLECTNQLLPFNYVHSSIAGHQALLVKEDGSSVVCRVREMPKVAGETMSIRVSLDEDGNGQGAICANYRQSAYEKMLGFMHTMSQEEQVNYLAERLKMQKATISDLLINTKHDEDPNLEVKFKLQAERYANKTGNRLFVPLSPLNAGSINLLRNGERTMDVFIPSAAPTVDTLLVELPEAYIAESIPQSLTVESDFGEYSINVQFEGQTLKVVQSLSLKPGKYPAAKAREFHEFLKKIDRESNRKAVFRLKG